MHTYVAVNEWSCFLCFIKELSPRCITKQKKVECLSVVYNMLTWMPEKRKEAYIFVLFMFL